MTKTPAPADNPFLSFVKTYGYLFVLAAFVAGAFGYMRTHRTDRQLALSGEGTPPLIAVESEAPAQTVSVLFTGNSITFVNNLPQMLSRIAAADRNSHLRFEIASDTHAGQSIAEVWQDGKALPLLQSRRWTYVVLQEHSWWVGRPDQIAQMQASVPLLARAVAANGSKPLLFMTYVKKPGSDWYRTEPEFQNPAYMQQSLDYYTYDVARRAGIPVVPIGDYWWRLMQAHPEIDLYSKDGTHPGMAGTYLMALMFYRILAHRDVRDIDFVPPGIGNSEAEIIRGAAAQ